MYPDFQYFFQNLFGAPMPEWLSIFKTFGFFVAIAFIAAAWTAIKEMKRKEEQGLLLPVFTTIEVGKPATPNELLSNAILGFIFGYKVGGLFGHWAEVAPNPMGYLFSLQGSLVIGIIGALLFGYIKYAEKKKAELPEPATKRVAIYPHQRISEIVVLAAVGGLAGAKIFNAFETWDDFIQDPVGNLISSSGLTFYGGLIVATAVLYYFSRKHQIKFYHLCDALAPGLMLAYGIGRLGCHFSGDGDWGIYNIAYVTQPNGILRAATPADTPNIMSLIGNVQHTSVVAPDWLPRWVVGMNYAHNVNNEGMRIADCVGNYCAVLPVSVFPTAVYEAITCALLFFFLWSIRKKIVKPLHLFGVYLILNGLERFFVELIRVNYKYDWGFIHPTQAEIISTSLILAGVCIFAFFKRKETPTIPAT